ncbi:Clathrin/coatomer adaptor adaptin-like protein [Lasiodiplodia theobromae]|uniref:Clathrin/coatomer adaptor adaptin-like protein n=1 Tax=Lasiodiplodia theobromae TaxID=45133 RepID=UPI0015C3865F|nr:Clathrin/coatomer adaptor adaptin-like protein [Lasiodiplodia theobromae]KAF4538557.1 Clathrin/coatomer adaptor adaptin-like protein [Lasiodiplodia theobromae]
MISPPAGTTPRTNNPTRARDDDGRHDAKMFEKSLYDLIRGLRNHKGNEREYIQESLRECRKEIKGSDMDLKATALLKLTYLEMFGHDMSWASFNVLEVMSSSKYGHKKIGYLAAVQSFRPDTEVLMLAENLLKKDLSSPQPTTITLPLSAIPHVINPSMANSLLSDLLPRLTHSHSSIRKKTVVTLYRLALVYPETLRPAWPRIKERLLDDDEDPSVTAAIVNVVCELGWRRPQDFLPLAPRLFDLLVQGGNNWMAIKIIKLFATLTPLEPRLIKKLLPPLTAIIKTTPAMSLLYECINGIIQGGILEGAEGTTEGEEIARLCVGKLRGMLVVEGDPNLKYVALLAFDKIVRSHPHLVSLHQDVILECIDDADISIRSQALGLVIGMVNPDNLTVIVGRLIRQLRNAPRASAADDPLNDRGFHEGVVPAADPSDDEAEESIRRNEKTKDQPPPLPEDYRIKAIKGILEMCARDTYANIIDFDWYIDVLVQLVRVSPSSKSASLDEELPESDGTSMGDKDDVSFEIGKELQNVAVRVKAVRPEATEAAQSLILVDRRDQMFPASGNGGQGVLGAAAWMVGEYASLLTNPEGVLNSLMHSSSALLPHHILAIYIQAVPKVFASVSSNEQVSWTSERKSTMVLLMARIVHFLEPLAMHPNLEVQERAVEYLELMRLASEAASGQEASPGDGDFVDPPLLLTQAIPSLFTGLELNPVAPGAQRKVPVPDELDLDAPINPDLPNLLRKADYESFVEPDEDDVYQFYSQRTAVPTQSEAAADRLEAPEAEPKSYQASAAEEEYLDPDIIARRKAERRARNKDDPFYIPTEDERSGTSTPLHNILKTNNGEDLDLDSIPIMDLDLETKGQLGGEHRTTKQPKRKVRKNFEILVDENLGPDEPSAASDSSRPELAKPTQKGKKSLLEVDSTGLASLSLEETGNSKLDMERREAEEAEMAKALKEVERLRLEMQRASERIQAKDVPPEGQLVKRKKKKAKKEAKGEPEAAEEENQQAAEDSQQAAGEGEAAVVKKKKKKKVKKQEDGAAEAEGDGKGKKKKKRRMVALEGEGAPGS